MILITCIRTFRERRPTKGWWTKRRGRRPKRGRISE